jgi:hypothetical protein
MCENACLEKLLKSSRNPVGILLDSRSPVGIGGGVKSTGEYACNNSDQCVSGMWT